MPLSARHQRFVDYRATGHSAEVNASRLRKRPDVAAACRATFDAAQAACQRVIDARAHAPIHIRGLGWYDPQTREFREQC